MAHYFIYHFIYFLFFNFYLPLYFIYHSHPCLFPALNTCLSHSFLSLQANPSQNEWKKNIARELGERPNDETAEDSKIANKKKIAFNRKCQESNLNYGFKP